MGKGDPLTTLLAGLITGWFGIGLALYFLFFMFIPVMIFSIMRSMKGIRRELSTLNETLQNKLIIR